jgi:DNA-binding CsgD family transcriptional regulator/PAS domain-containing protein
MTSEAELVSLLVGDIYDAALDPALWRGVLEKITGFVGGHSAGLGSINSISREPAAHYTFGCDPHYLQLHVDTYMKFDPTSTMFFFPSEQVASIADLMPYEEFRDTRFYREWAQPQGFVDAANAVIDKSTTHFAVLCVYRHEAQGLVDDAMRRRMQLIVPHVRRAVMIGDVIELRTTKTAAFADALDGLSAAMFLVDAEGRLVHANSSGHDLIGEGDILHSAQGVLTPVDPRAAKTLRDVIAAASGGDTAIGIGGIAVALSTSPDRRWLAHILPLTSGARRRAGITYAAVAAVFVRKASLDTPSLMETIAKLYKLTPSELRVFAAIVDVGGVSAVAEALGIAEATVKTHLQHLFEKTGLRRQTDLVKMLAGHANPLRA